MKHHKIMIFDEPRKNVDGVRVNIATRGPTLKLLKLVFYLK